MTKSQGRISIVSFYEKPINGIPMDDVVIKCISVKGAATLILGEADNLQYLSMEKFKFYNIKKGAWHHIFLKEDAKVLIVENSDTGKDNTEYHHLK